MLSADTLGRMPNRTALIVGEALIDQFPDKSVVAGAPVHVAAHLASLGWRASLVTRLGRDPDGDAIAWALERRGIAVDYVERDDDLPTGRTVIGLDDRGGHTFDVLRPAAWDGIVGPEPVPPHDVLCFGTLPFRSPSCSHTIRRLVTLSTALIVVDLNLRPPWVAPGAVAYCVAHADVLKMNESELAAGAEVLGIAPDPHAFAEQGPTWVCVTRGAQGAQLVHRDGRKWETAGIATPVIDTVGAGDAFLSHLVDRLISGADPASALDTANSAAARIVGRRGGLG
jgi:fructokinase